MIVAPNGFEVSDLNDYGFRTIPEYNGMTIEEIGEYENNGCDLDTTAFAET